MIIELVGPPGVGKTTLAQSLLQRSRKARAEYFPYFREIRWIPFFTVNFLFLSPTLFHWVFTVDGRELHPRDIAIMTILQGWHRVLKRKTSEDDKIVILEEGAVCLLAKLLFWGSEFMRGDHAQHWWITMYQRWAATLDVIVLLEAPAAVLVERVRSRNCLHEISQLSDPQAETWFEGIRNAQNQVIANLMAESQKLRLLNFHSVSETPTQICNQLRAIGIE